MPDQDVRFEPASASTPAELTALWNRAYEAYFVPLVLTEANLSHHLRRSGVDLDRSLVGRIGGEPFGLSLAAVRGERAWIGGFGVAVEHRRRGLGARMLDEHLMRLDLAQIAETSLEVIAHNPARELYRKAGFAERGAALQLIGGQPRQVAAQVGVELAPASLAEAHQRIPRTEPLTWRRGLPTLEDDLRHGAHAFGHVVEGRAEAFAVVQDMGHQTALLDAAASDEAAARALLGVLVQRRPARPLRIVDEPEDSPLARAMRAAGLTVGLTQVEMARRRGG